MKDDVWRKFTEISRMIWKQKSKDLILKKFNICIFLKTGLFINDVMSKKLESNIRYSNVQKVAKTQKESVRNERKWFKFTERTVSKVFNLNCRTNINFFMSFQTLKWICSQNICGKNYREHFSGCFALDIFRRIFRSWTSTTSSFKLISTAHQNTSRFTSMNINFHFPLHHLHFAIKNENSNNFILLYSSNLSTIFSEKSFNREFRLALFFI